MAQKKIKTKSLDLKKLNNLSLEKVNNLQFPSINILKKLPVNLSLFETVLVSSNDEMVRKYLNKKIRFDQIVKNVINFINLNEFKKFKRIKPNKVQDIIKLTNYVRLKI